MTRQPTAFEGRVYSAISRIPAGCVSTYAEVAREVGCGSAQAVGQVLKRNPFAPKVPCHRVIASDLSSGGFMGEAEGARIRAKLALLKTEGVAFKNDRLADPAQVFRFKETAGRLTRRP